MFRRSLVNQVGGYDPALTTSQDRDLWSRALLVSRVVNVPQRLLSYRVHPGSISATRHAEQRRNSPAIRRRLLERFLGGDDPGRVIEHWYDDRLDQATIHDLPMLFLESYAALVRRLDPPESELRTVREDLAARLDSLRRRDGRVEAGVALRTAIRRLLPRALRRRGRASPA